MSTSLDSIRKKLGPEPRRIGIFRWADKVFSIPDSLRGMMPDDEPLIDTLLRQKEIWREGKIVWGHIVVANRGLYRPGKDDLPGEVVYSLNAADQEALEKLPKVANALSDAKFAEKEPDEFAPQEREIVEHLRQERERAFGMRVPTSVSHGLECYTSTFWAHRAHLPEGELGGKLVPLLVLVRKVHDVLIIPFKFWPDEMSVPWSTAVKERAMVRFISRERIASTRAWIDGLSKMPPPIPWHEATPEALGGTWASESETMLCEFDDGFYGSQWVSSRWRFDIEQRCWLEIKVRFLSDGQTDESEPVVDVSYEGTYELQNGRLTCTLPDHSDSPLTLVISSSKQLFNHERSCFLPVTPSPEVRGVSEGGSTLFRHSERAAVWTPPDMSQSNMRAIEEHIEEHIGKIDTVFHELVSDLVHIDIHVVKPTQERPWITLVTSGMSDRAMNPPDDAKALAYAEIMLCLPPTWKLSQDDFMDERHYWPVRWLKALARLPHEYSTWLGYWHTVPNGDPAEPLASDTQLSGFMLVPPMTTSVDFHELVVPPLKTIRFFAAIPLTSDEMQFKLKAGAGELMERLERKKITELINPSRGSVLS
jgi:hypothetical protein